MLDSHPYHHDWGLQPVLFTIFGLEVHSYPVMIVLALASGIIVYILQTKGQKGQNNLFWLFIAALIGGGVGAKLPVVLINIEQITSAHNFDALFSGRTVIGGMIGGTVAVIIARKILKMKEKKGNLFVPAISLAIAVGRIGCLLQGCCFGKATSAPWGVDFGDGVKRHPTQIYEIIFFLGWFFLSLVLNKKKQLKAGILFQIFIVSYFIFRFLVEYLREEKVVYFGLTLGQLVSLIVILYNIFAYLYEEVYGPKTKSRSTEPTAAGRLTAR